MVEIANRFKLKISALTPSSSPLEEELDETRSKQDTLYTNAIYIVAINCDIMILISR